MNFLGVYKMDKENLIQFETLVAEKFNNAEIRAPIHLYYNKKHLSSEE
jgi:hypothetical protein